MSELKFEYHLAQINVFLLPIALLINIFHLSILIRKELRSLSVFIIMISICSCDIIYLFSNILYFLNTIRTYQRTDYCYGFDSFVITLINIFNNFTCAIALDSSLWLVVIMAFYRSLSVTFPLNQFIKKLISPRITVAAVITVITLCVISTIWPYLFVFSIEKWDFSSGNCDCTDNKHIREPDQYRLVYNEDMAPVLDFIVNAEQWVINFQLIAYLFCVVILILSLKKARKPLSVSNQKTDNTTKLVLAMTIVFLVTQLFHPILHFSYLFLSGEEDLPLSLKNIYIAIKSFLQTIHTVSHCPLSFFMSTVYKDTVKRVFGVRKKMKVVSVTGSVNSKGSARI